MCPHPASLEHVGLNSIAKTNNMVLSCVRTEATMYYYLACTQKFAIAATAGPSKSRPKAKSDNPKQYELHYKNC